jgi:uncharacterized membrane protein
MPSWLSAYLITGAVFVLADAVWLSAMAPRFYRSQLGELMRDQVVLAPAIIFYIVYVGALTALVVLPALATQNATRALIYGCLFGLAAYGTYDLTNAATLKGWPLALTLVDLTWGVLATGLAACVSVLALTALSPSAQ